MSMFEDLSGHMPVVDADIEAVRLPATEQTTPHLANQMPEVNLLLSAEFPNAAHMVVRDHNGMAIDGRRRFRESNRVLILNPLAAGIERTEGAHVNHDFCPFYLYFRRCPFPFR